jgi:hypothetical protein
MVDDKLKQDPDGKPALGYVNAAGDVKNVSPTTPLPTTAVEGDIQIGAVELKDHDSTTRADIETDSTKGALFVQSESLATQATLNSIKSKTDTLNFDGSCNLMVSSEILATESTLNSIKSQTDILTFDGSSNLMAVSAIKDGNSDVKADVADVGQAIGLGVNIYADVPAESAWTAHRVSIAVADADDGSVNTVDHTDAKSSQALAVLSDGVTECTLVMEVEMTANGTNYCRTQSYAISRSQAFKIDHGGGHVRTRITALTGASPDVDIYLKKV